MEARPFVVATWQPPEVIAASTEAAGAKMEAMEALEADGGGAVTTRRVTQVAAVLVVRWGLAIASMAARLQLWRRFVGQCPHRERGTNATLNKGGSEDAPKTRTL